MSRLLGYVGNDASLVRCAMHRVRNDLSGPGVEEVDGWGLGYEQESRILLRLKPNESTPIDLVRLTSDLRTHAAVVHVRRATVGSRTTENTQPFRFKSWLFGHLGTIDGICEESRYRDELPDFLQRNLHGGTDSEIFFHWLLFRLKEAGVRLQSPMMSPEETAIGTERCLLDLEGWARDSGVAPIKSAMLLTNGRQMVVATLGVPIFAYRVDGIDACPICEGEPLFAGHKPKQVHHPRFKAWILADGIEAEAEGWTQINDREVTILGEEGIIRRRLGSTLA